MRLDHLLSKEHMALLLLFCRCCVGGVVVVVSRAAPRTNASGLVLTGGTLTSWRVRMMLGLVQLCRHRVLRGLSGLGDAATTMVFGLWWWGVGGGRNGRDGLGRLRHAVGS